MSDLTPIDPEFWRLRLERGISLGEPHRAVIDESAEWYAAVNARTAKVIRQLLDFYRPVTSFLDAGCGLGDVCEMLPDYVEYLGIDLCPEMIECAKARHGRLGRSFRAGDLTKEIGVSMRYDIVFSRGLEGTVREAAGTEAVDRMNRILASAAKVIVVSAGIYRPGRFDLIRPDSLARVRCIDVDLEEEAGVKL